MTHRVISEEQIVAAHHTQLAMVTGLCHEEMVLLKQRDKDNQVWTPRNIFSWKKVIYLVIHKHASWASCVFSQEAQISSFVKSLDVITISRGD